MSNDEPEKITEKILLVVIEQIDDINTTRNAFNTYSFEGTDPHDFDDENCKIVINAYHTNFKPLHEWLDIVDTDLNVLKTVIRILHSFNININFNTIDFKKIFAKKNIDMNIYWFKYFLQFIHVRTLNENELNTLIEWYEPISDSGILHWELFDNWKFDEFLKMSEKYSFDIHKPSGSKRILIEMRKTSHFCCTTIDNKIICITFENIYEHLQQKSLKTLCDKNSSVKKYIIRSFQNNFDNLRLDEKTLFIDFIKSLPLLDIQLIYLREMLDVFKDEIRNAVKNDSGMTFYLCKSDNIELFDFVINIMNEENMSFAEMEYDMIRGGSEIILNHYYGEFTQETINNFVKKYGHEIYKKK